MDGLTSSFRGILLDYVLDICGKIEFLRKLAGWNVDVLRDAEVVEIGQGVASESLGIVWTISQPILRDYKTISILSAFRHVYI